MFLNSLIVTAFKQPKAIFNRKIDDLMSTIFASVDGPFHVTGITFRDQFFLVSAFLKNLSCMFLLVFSKNNPRISVKLPVEKLIDFICNI